MRSRNAVDIIGIVLVAVLIALATAGCSLSQCIRHSDCPAELICSSVGRCELPPPPDTDGGDTDGGEVDGGDTDGGTSDLETSDLGASDLGASDLVSSSDLTSDTDLATASDLASDNDLRSSDDLNADTDLPSSGDLATNGDLFTDGDMATSPTDLPTVPPRSVRPPWQILTPPPPGTIKPGIFPVDTVSDMAPFDLIGTDVRAVSP